MTQPTSSDNAYPVQLTATPPEHYERVQLLLRLLVCAAIGLLHQSLGSIAGALYLLLPTLAAILISQRGGQGFLARDGGWIGGMLEWLVGLYAYMLFVTDRFPLEAETRVVRLRIVNRGTPTLVDALLRLLTSLPHALVLGLLALVSSVISFILAFSILFTTRAPRGLCKFQSDFVGWLARFFAYHGSLVDTYPPFALSGVAHAQSHDGYQSV